METSYPHPKNILITGQPGIGKTTVIKKLAHELKKYHPAGFYTDEIREKGVRKGFELASLYGRTGILSHINIKSPYQVGKYHVDIGGFEKFLDFIPFLNPEIRLVIIDEIGKMESFSNRFIDIMNKLLESDKFVIATIALHGTGIIQDIRSRKDVKLIQLTHENRDNIIPDILKMISLSI